MIEKAYKGQVNALEKQISDELDDYEPEFTVGELSRIFLTLKAEKYGASIYSISLQLKNPRIKKLFNNFSEDLKKWEQEGLNIRVGDYFNALFEVFGKNTFASHLRAKCGLPIYYKFLEQRIKSDPEMTPEERNSYREAKIKEAMLNFQWDRETVVRNFGSMLPSV